MLPSKHYIVTLVTNYVAVMYMYYLQINEGTSENPRTRANGHLPGATTTVGIVGGAEEEKKSPKTSTTRLKSLDSFRG